MSWIFGLFSWLTINLLALWLAPFLPLFARISYGPINNGSAKGNEPRLPWWLSWFQTPDNSLWGDEGHKERWGTDPNGVNYFQMVAWLYRNPAYGFEGDGPLAALITPDMLIAYSGNPDIKNRDNAVAGKLFAVVWNDAQRYWCWKMVSEPFWDGETCLMMEFGWKLQPYAQKPERLKTEPKAQFVFSIRFTAFYKG